MRTPITLARLIALLAIGPTACAQNNASTVPDPDLEHLYELNKNWANAPSLPVHTSADEEPTIVDFARAFMKQYPDPFTRSVLAKLDGRDPQTRNAFEFHLDAPNGYLKSTFSYGNCGRRCLSTMEMRDWQTANGHRLVALAWDNWSTNLLLFYDYSPETKRMTPLLEPPFKNFYDTPQEMTVELLSQGKDIRMKPACENGPQPLTLRWDGHGTFTTVGATERYRQPAASSDVAFYARAYFSLNRKEETKKDAALYDAPGGTIVRRLTPEEQKTHVVMLARVRGSWAQIKYAPAKEGQGEKEMEELLQGKNEAQFRSAWVPLSSLYVSITSNYEPKRWTRYLYAEPTLSSRRIYTLDENHDWIWSQLLEARKGWVKVQLQGSEHSGWIETRHLYGNKVSAY